MVKQVSGRAPSLWRAASTGLLLAVVWTIGCAMVLAKLLDSEIIKMESLGYGSMVTVLSGVFLGASTAGRRTGHMAALASGATGAAYYLSLLLVNALFFGGGYTGMGVTLVLVALASVAAAALGRQGRGAPRRRRYKIPRG